MKKGTLVFWCVFVWLAILSGFLELGQVWGIVFICLSIVLGTIFAIVWDKKNEKKIALEREKKQREERVRQIEQERKERERQIQLEKIEKEKRDQKFIRENSKLIQEINKLNDGYKINLKVCRSNIIKHQCKNKNEYDNFDIDKYFIKKIRDDLENFNTYKGIVEEEEKKWCKYSKKYKSLVKYQIKNENYSYDIPFDYFSNYENKVYQNSMKSKYTLPNYFIKVEYMTPAKRNFYEKKFLIRYDKLLELIDKANQPEEEKVSQSSLRSLDKERQKLEAFEKELKQQAENLKKQQEEFLLATKGHIYSGDVSKETPQQYNTGINEEKIETKSIMDNLKELKQKFESGEISYEEYEKKRKELM